MLDTLNLKALRDVFKEKLQELKQKRFALNVELENGDGDNNKQELVIAMGRQEEALEAYIMRSIRIMTYDYAGAEWLLSDTNVFLYPDKDVDL